MDTKQRYKKIGIFAIVCALIVMVLTAGFLATKNTRRFKQTIVTQTQGHLLNVAESKAYSIERHILDIRNDLQRLAENPVLRHSLVENIIIGDDSYSPAKLLYTHLSGQIDALYRLNTDGIIQERIPFKEKRIGRNYSHKPGIKTVMQTHKPYISELFKSSSGKPGISICCPVFKDKSFIGIVRATYYVNRLHEIVGHIKVGKEGFAFIIDDKGIIVSHPNERFVGKRLLEISKKQLGEDEKGEIEIINQMVAGRKGTAFLTFDKFFQTKSMISWAPIRIANKLWSIGVVMSYDEIAAPVKAYTRKLFAATGVLFLVFVTAGIWFYKIQREKTKLSVKAESAGKLSLLNEQLEKETSDLKLAKKDLTKEIEHRRRAEEQLQGNLAELSQTKQALLNMMGDSEKARKETEQLNEQLQVEITEREKAQKEQAGLLKKVESTNNELKDFAHIVSHDLKAPLRGVSTIANWLVADYADKLDENGKEQLDILISRVQRMHDLIEGVLRYSRAGSTEEEKVQVNLNDMLPGVIDMVAPPENINITIEDQMPTIICDHTRIAQVFQNLLSNAVKYMDKPQGIIKIGCVEDNGYWKFSVTDNGPGIEEKDFERVFQMFQTLTAKDEFESTGVGLTVIKKIVELYGGKIWLESEVGDGSTFYFTLPKQESKVSGNTELQANIVS
ncbi:MAG: Cache 3/Cache 2 fusion domain-containing protein [Planctomycetes bacterium]|nr:Cache 3/Cache 2 fusion domain-containing protein [Planctomycetota bacterium]